MTALIPIFISALPEIIKAGQAVAGFVMSFREAAKQADVWTAEHEAQFQEELNKAGLAHWSLTDAEIEGQS